MAGSQTSFEAAEAIKPDRARLRQEVYEFIAANGPCSDEAIAQGLSMNPSTARPRRLELERAGSVEKAGRTITQAGRKCWAWQVTWPDHQG